ncbi:MAG: hypothetical protein GEV11_00160 [Streptosporangiales bacterium]|nr:hypothetical protein [Streptosporangiales bacterium]
MNDHVEAEVIAELAEGLLDAETTAEVTAHLHDCAECQEVAAALAGVSRTLAATPAPALPTHVAEGIDTRLAQEAAVRGRTGPEAAAATEVTSLASARRLRWSRALAAAAAAVVLVGGGFAVVRDMLQQRQHGSAASAPLARDDGGAGESEKLTTRDAAPTLRTGTDYTSAGLRAQAAALVHRVPSAAPSPEPQIGTEGGAPAPELAGCLADIAERSGRRVLLADEARYEGSPATLVVLSGATAGTAEVLVVPGDCAPGDDAVARRVTVPRD